MNIKSSAYALLFFALAGLAQSLPYNQDSSIEWFKKWQSSNFWGSYKHRDPWGEYKPQKNPGDCGHYALIGKLVAGMEQTSNQSATGA
jgi:hypothetical protein